MLLADGFESLITALYPKGDVYIKSDAVFGVKTSLMVELVPVHNDEEAKALGFPKGGPFWRLDWDFVLQTKAQAEVEKRKSLAVAYKFEN